MNSDEQSGRVAGNEHVLMPGYYLIEMEFDRPVLAEVLYQALTRQGFGLVVFDQSVPTEMSGVGAAPGAVAKGGPAGSFKAAVTSKFSPAQTLALQTSATTPKVKPVDPGAAAPITPKAFVSTQKARAQDVASAFQSKTVAPPSGPLGKKSPPRWQPGGPTAPGGDPSQPSQPTAPAETDPAAAAEELPPLVPSGTAVEPTAEPTPVSPDGGGGFVPPSSAAPAEGEAPFLAAPTPDLAPPAEVPTDRAPALPFDPVEMVKKAIYDLWQKWKEWGSVARSSGHDAHTHFRLIGRLDSQISLNDGPDRRWLYVRKLAIDPFSNLGLQLFPHPLGQGRNYELRFVARIRDTSSREAVLENLVRMGFSPEKIFALKRDMRLPGRPVSVTLWYAVGRWMGPDSVVVSEDPFYFEDVKEVTT